MNASLQKGCENFRFHENIYRFHFCLFLLIKFHSLSNNASLLWWWLCFSSLSFSLPSISLIENLMSCLFYVTIKTLLLNSNAILIWIWVCSMGFVFDSSATLLSTFVKCNVKTDGNLNSLLRIYIVAAESEMNQQRKTVA